MKQPFRISVAGLVERQKGEQLSAKYRAAGCRQKIPAIRLWLIRASIVIESGSLSAGFETCDLPCIPIIQIDVELQ